LAWTIEYSNSARQVLRKLDRQIARRIVAFMDDRVAISDNPRNFGKALAGPLDRYWSYRVGDYRLVCEIHDAVLTILVIDLGNRREIYR
jgi:mRNA interferase RelE/StbE